MNGHDHLQSTVQTSGTWNLSNTLESFSRIDYFMPHGCCYQWNPRLVLLHNISDLFIFLSYLTIPAALIYLVRKRSDLPFNWMFALFALFIISCGTTHLMEIITLYRPYYWLSGYIKAVTAAASVPTAMLLFKLVPKALAIPSPQQLREANQALEKEITERRETEAALRRETARLQLLLETATAANSSNAPGDTLRETLTRLGTMARWPLGEAFEVRASEEHEPAQTAAVSTGLWYVEPGAGPALLEFQTAAVATEDRREATALAASAADASGAPSLVQEVIRQGQPRWSAELGSLLPPGLLAPARAAELRQVLAFPVLVQDEVVAVLQFFSRETQAPDQRLIEVIGNVGTQLGRTYERHRALARLADQSEKLGRSNSELEQFAYVASHDLQEPLRTVSSYLQLIEKRYKDKLDDSASEFIGFAVDGAKRMQQLIRDLLEYSRVGTKPPAAESVSMRVVLEQVLDNMAVAVEEAQARIVWDSASVAVVQGDSGQLAQLFQNLIGNAIKFRRPDVAPLVRVQARPVEGNRWEFSIEDNGIGIEPQYAERVFQVFQRLHTREQYAGTGIGLAICKKIVERHGGLIRIEPAEEAASDKGTRFVFTLPAPGSTAAKRSL